MVFFLRKGEYSRKEGGMDFARMGDILSGNILKKKSKQDILIMKKLKKAEGKR